MSKIGQGTRVEVVQIRTMKIYVAAMEALRERKRDEAQFTTKINLGPSYYVL